MGDDDRLDSGDHGALAACLAARSWFMLCIRFSPAEAPSAGAFAAFASALFKAPLLPFPLLAGVPGLPIVFGLAGPEVPGI